MIRKRIGETMSFTGGAESTPRVMVSAFLESGSLNQGTKNLSISQGNNLVILSEETIEAILAWAREE